MHGLLREGCNALSVARVSERVVKHGLLREGCDAWSFMRGL